MTIACKVCGASTEVKMAPGAPVEQHVCDDQCFGDTVDVESGQGWVFIRDCACNNVSGLPNCYSAQSPRLHKVRPR